ncbi:tyrosine-type recombinase/integrase, partial [Cupriavidus sp. IDO]|uniref:tyrosine-type recombinase/integrase n=1 Tax=Cupriavidus sp. IDO TaxID=1539142 RepID=UPI0005795029
MNSQPSLARHLESFFHQRLTQQRNATRATVAAYRDALRLLVLFASERTGKKPCALAVEDLDRDMILAYLDHLEHSRGNCVHTRNARLTAIRSFFQHVAAIDPASIGVAQRVLSIPSKKSDVPMPHYLSRAELDALLDAPSKSSPCGRRDRVLLLFLARTGARVSEALCVEAADLSLNGARSHVMLRGKGRKQRVVPLASDLVAAIGNLLRESGIARHEHVPVFVGARGERLTRFGATHVVRRAVATASERMPELARKEISPHVFRH